MMNGKTLRRNVNAVHCLIVLLSIHLGVEDNVCRSQQLHQVDLLLRNGNLHLGDGSPSVVGDVAIVADKIVAVGRLKPETRVLRTIDCSGLIVCPGFIDLHNHSDGEILDKETRSAMNYLTQGCTSLVTGNCGSGPIDVAKYYDSIDKQSTGINILHLLPQGSLRREVMGTDQRQATVDELKKMQALAEQAMQDGAWGMSSGLIYVPSSYADTDELVAIAEVVGRHGGLYASHVRNEGLQLLDSIHEALEIGQRAKIPVHISHFKSSGKDSWGIVRSAIELIRDHRDHGQVVTADQYPYTASSTSLGATFIPAWARSGTASTFAKRLAAGDQDSQRIRDAILAKLEITENGHRVQIASYAKHPEWAGRRIDEVAEQLAIEPLELILQIQRDGGCSVVNHGINEQDVQFVMQQDWVATASDGSAKIPSADVPHPRSYGTFPRRIGHYSIGHQVIPLEQAIASATGLPATILGIGDRGYLREGYFADIAVIDGHQFIDRATYEDPHQYSEGVVHLFVNGKQVLSSGRATGALAGRAIRRTAATP